MEIYIIQTPYMFQLFASQKIISLCMYISAYRRSRYKFTRDVPIPYVTCSNVQKSRLYRAMLRLYFCVSASLDRDEEDVCEFACDLDTLLNTFMSIQTYGT